MEVVTVQPHIEDVERAHRGPSIALAEGDRNDAVGDHPVAESPELSDRRRDRVAFSGKQTLPIHDRPRVVVHRDEVRPAVRAERRRLQARRHVLLDVRPDIVDRLEQTLRCEEADAVTGEPLDDVVGRLLQVRADLILEGVMVVDVHPDVDTRRAFAVVDDGLNGPLRAGVALVGAKRGSAATSVAVRTCGDYGCHNTEKPDFP